jgi:hypothetical protein
LLVVEAAEVTAEPEALVVLAEVVTESNITLATLALVLLIQVVVLVVEPFRVLSLVSLVVLEL